ncbi:MAG TPA: ABC transporter ATP-binding protein [bacterium]|jgi:putative ABC transport system ATP-binding protein|nr:ABC transporter ATP-binding protein [bacterium]
MGNSIVRVQNVYKSFHVGNQDVSVLKDVSLEVNPLDFLIIFGPSGCGKSTLLHTILGLEKPTNGQVYFMGNNIYESMDENDRSDFRKRHIGMVYQQSNWVQSLNVIENVVFPLLLLGWNKQRGLEKAREMLETVGMLDWQNYIPTELSSGQQQRVALARALVANPEVIIADEPTGNLDYDAGQDLMQLLTNLNKTKNNTIVMVTHDLEYLSFAKTAIRMFNGKIVDVFNEDGKEKLALRVKSKRGNGDPLVMEKREIKEANEK